MGRALPRVWHRVLSRKHSCYYWASHSTFLSLRSFTDKIKSLTLIHPFNAHPLSPYYVPGPVLSTGDRAIHTTDSTHGANILIGEVVTDKRQICVP